MFTLFSIAFMAIFTAFVIAAIVGHILLIDALIRPFFVAIALGPRLTPTRHAPAG